MCKKLSDSRIAAWQSSTNFNARCAPKFIWLAWRRSVPWARLGLVPACREVDPGAIFIVEIAPLKWCS